MKPKKVYQHIPALKVSRLREQGYTLQEIGDYFNVSKQRIWQILHPKSKKIAGWDVNTWRQRRKERNRIVEAD